MSHITYGITEKIGTAATLEQLAEECTELAQAALKLARIERKQNPTPLHYEEAYNRLIEETGDVRICLDVLEDALGPIETTDIELSKLRRWRHRIKAYYNPDPEPVENADKII